MKKLLFSILIASAFSYAQAQSTIFQWAGTINGKDKQESKSITVDPSGNVITVGYFVDSSDLDPTTGILYVTPSPSKSAEDIFINKLDASGNLLWTKSLTGGKYKRANKVVADASGNIYLTGSFTGTTDFDPGSSVFNLSAESTLVPDIFVLKLSSDGTFVWAVMLKNGPVSTGIDDAKSIAIDAASNVYITGEFRGKIDFDPSTSGTNIIDATPGANAFILKLDNSGNFVKVVNIENTPSSISDISGVSVSVDGSGNMYLAGLFNNEVDFDPSASTASITATATLGNKDVFLAKYDVNGNYVWAKNISGIDTKKLGAMVADNAGNTYLTGSFKASCTFGTTTLTAPEYDDIFVAKYDASGNNLWAKQFSGGGTFNDGGTDIVVDGSGSVYSTGNFTDKTDFDPNGGTAFLNNPYPSLVVSYVSKLDASGNYLWSDFAGQVDTGSCISKGISLDGSGNILICGFNDGTIHFTSGASKVYFPYLGKNDAFIAKLSQGTSSIRDASASKSFGIFPNPNAGLFSINVEPNTSVEIFNMLGESLFQKLMTNSSNTIDISSYPSGLYYLKVVHNGIVLGTEKIMKQ